MKILYIDAWDSDELRNNFYNKIIKVNPDKVVFFGHQEFEYKHLTNFEKIIKWHKDNNKIFYITTLGYQEDCDIVNKNIKIYHWIDWYFKKIFISCLWKCKKIDEMNYSSFNFYKKGLSFKNYKHFLTSLNYNAHPHRKLMIDLLAKNDLIKNNAIAWHNKKVAGFEFYKFRYFKEQVLTLSNNFGSDWDNPPDQYYESFVQLISESSDKISCFSEKTVMALICHKPFLIVGPAGLHKKLKELGFALYTELFDYSFDNEIDEEKRYQMVMENLINLKKLYDYDMGESLQKQILPKLKYNFDRVIKIAFDFSTIPDVVEEFRREYKGQKINHTKFLNEVLDTLEEEKANFLNGDTNT